MSVVDSNGVVTLWNDALERILGCPARTRAGPLARRRGAGPGQDRAPASDQRCPDQSEPRTLAHLGLRFRRGRADSAGQNISRCRWRDAALARRHRSERSRNTRSSEAKSGSRSRRKARMTGLWEWDLRTQEFYFSGRWRAMIGLPAPAGIGRPEEWMDRVHADDIAAAQGGARGASLRQDRITFSTSTGSATRTAPTGGSCAAVSRCAAPAGAPSRIAGSLTDTTERAIAQGRRAQRRSSSIR